MEELLELIEGNPDPRELKRALAVKLVMQDYSYREIQKILNVSIGFISKWKQIFESLGVNGLNLSYKGASSYLNSQQRMDVITWLKSKAYWDLTELQHQIEDKYRVTFKSKQSYYDLFAEAGISWKKTQKKNPRKDPDLVEQKKKEIIAFLEERQPEIQEQALTVFMIDECHLLWGDVCGYVWGQTNIRVQVPMTSQREKQTYFGALDYRNKEFLVQAYPAGNSENTVKFLHYLQVSRPGQKVLVIWDGASYHKSAEIKDYLQSVNRGLSQQEWQLTCILFAPHAPEQNPVEDLWLQAKNFVRKFYYLCKSFSSVKRLFTLVTHHQIFDFSKLYLYG